MFYIGGWMETMPSIIIRYESAIDTAIKIIVILPRKPKLEKNSLESFAKLRIEYAINYRVESWVRVAKPGENFEGCVVNARFTEGRNDVRDEKWHPGNCAEKWKMKFS